MDSSSPYTPGRLEGRADASPREDAGRSLRPSVTMNSTPAASSTSPIGVKSKSWNGWRPASPSTPAVRMLGGVPTRVVVPPRIAPNASGMKSREGARPAWRARLATAGSSTAVAATLFMKAESNPAAVMSSTIRGTSRSPTSAWIRLPMASATPVLSRPSLMKKTESMVMTAGEEKPVNASEGKT